MVVPTLFGLESFTAREVRALGYETTAVEDGRVTFVGDAEAVALSNLWIRTGERVLIKIAEFDAFTFDELFEKTKAAPWDEWIGKDAAFPVKGHTLKSKLASERDCQAIIKKAVADSLSASYKIDWLEESGPVYQIQFSIRKDRVTLMIDTSGDGLHKRGYRKVSNDAPLRETIAAAMIQMSHWKWEYPLADPFCGSGTIPIEAAMIKRNIAPGLRRSFAAEAFVQIPEEVWAQAREEAAELQKDVPLDIWASDIDSDAVNIAKENARLAGVEEFVKPRVLDARKFSKDKPYGTIISNPPYGERISTVRECEALYRDMGKWLSVLDNWSYYILVPHEGFERLFGRKANKKRKIYNGMIRCDVYQYFGARPPFQKK